MKAIKVKRSVFFAFIFFSIFILLIPLKNSFAETGANFFIGPVGLVQMGGNNRDLGAGPGVTFGVGYDWEKVGVRGKFLIGALDDTGGLDDSVEFFNFGADLKLYILDFIGHPESPLRPWALVGVGCYFLTEGSVEDNDNATGVGVVFGFGLDYRAFEFLSFGFENNFHIIGLLEDAPGGDNGFAMYFYTVTGTVIFHF